MPIRDFFGCFRSFSSLRRQAPHPCVFFGIVVVVVGLPIGRSVFCPAFGSTYRGICWHLSKNSTVSHAFDRTRGIMCEALHWWYVQGRFSGVHLAPPSIAPPIDGPWPLASIRGCCTIARVIPIAAYLRSPQASTLPRGAEASTIAAAIPTPITAETAWSL